jgi:hypothetical protein
MDNQSRFGAASKYGHSTLTDPKQRARYSEAAAKTGITVTAQDQPGRRTSKTLRHVTG